MDFDEGVRQRKAMASGGSMASGDFGCKPLDHSQGPAMSPEAMMKGGPLADSGRSAGGPVRHRRGRLRAQANPDHGHHG